MTAELRFFWARLNANYWFYPALFSLLAAVLATIMVYLDRSGFAEFLNDVEWIVPARPKGAADMLTVMAGSMIGVASTVFSITIAAVAYASGNYGPRLLTNFMEDRGNQVSLATFIGSFVYALIVLRAVRAEDETPATTGEAAATALPGFTPQLSLLVAYILLGGLLGPWGLGLIDDASLIREIGHIGIMFLLFLLGLNLQPAQLLRMFRDTTVVTLVSSLGFCAAGCDADNPCAGRRQNKRGAPPEARTCAGDAGHVAREVEQGARVSHWPRDRKSRRGNTWQGAHPRRGRGLPSPRAGKSARWLRRRLSSPRAWCAAR